MLRLLLCASFCVQFFRSSSLLLPQITCISALEVDGWEMFFPAKPGSGKSVYNAWFLASGVSTVKPIAEEQYCETYYRDSRVDQWNSLNVRQVKYAVYYQKKEVAFIIFYGTGSNLMNWFHNTRVLVSSYSDLVSSATYNYFSIDGHFELGRAYRRFFVNKVYKGCPGDNGWLVNIAVGSTASCIMDNLSPLPQFL